jgi:uncharacterized membrane protein YkvA (DUF1232 family)
MRIFLYVLAAIVVVWLLVVGFLLVIGRRLAARKLFRWLPDMLGMFSGVMRDRRVPRSTKILVGIALAWIASPIDLIPEFIPVLGPLDDVVITLLVLRRVVKRAGRHVVAEHWKGDPETLERVFRLARI